MIFCNQDISKTITAMRFDLGQVIEDNGEGGRYSGEKKIKKLLDFFFWIYCPLQIFGIENL